MPQLMHSLQRLTKQSFLPFPIHNKQSGLFSSLTCIFFGDRALHLARPFQRKYNLGQNTSHTSYNYYRLSAIIATDSLVFKTLCTDKALQNKHGVKAMNGDTERGMCCREISQNNEMEKSRQSWLLHSNSSHSFLYNGVWQFDRKHLVLSCIHSSFSIQFIFFPVLSYLVYHLFIMFIIGKQFLNAIVESKEKSH